VYLDQYFRFFFNLLVIFIWEGIWFFYFQPFPILLPFDPLLTIYNMLQFLMLFISILCIQSVYDMVGIVTEGRPLSWYDEVIESGGVEVVGVTRIVIQHFLYSSLNNQSILQLLINWGTALLLLFFFLYWALGSCPIFCETYLTLLNSRLSLSFLFFNHFFECLYILLFL